MLQRSDFNHQISRTYSIEHKTHIGMYEYPHFLYFLVYSLYNDVRSIHNHISSFFFTCYKNIQRTNIRVPYRSFYVIFIASFTPSIHTTLSTISQLPLPVDQVTLPILLSLIGKHSKYKGPHSLSFSQPLCCLLQYLSLRTSLSTFSLSSTPAIMN